LLDTILSARVPHLDLLDCPVSATIRQVEVFH
jgi:hypothetical protein